MNQKSNKNNQKNPLSSYIKYSGMAFQMFAVIGLGVFGGFKIDKWLQFQIPIFTIILSFISVFFAIYYFIKDVLK